MMSLVGHTLDSGDQSEKITVWALFGITMLMAIAALVKIVKNFIRAASTTELRQLPMAGFNVRPSADAGANTSFTDQSIV